MKPSSFLTKIDLKDAFYSTPIAKNSRKYLQFIYNNKLYQFYVLPFGISTAPQVFSKILKPVIALLRTRGICLIIIYLDDLFIAAGTYIGCLSHTKQAVSLLESPGFRINYEKSAIIPTQKLEYLSFIIDTASMTLYIPSRKNSVDTIISSKASSNKSYYLNKTAFKIHRPLHFSKTCCLPRTCLHYRSLQFPGTSVLKGRQYFPSLYSLKVCLSPEALTDLKWWTNHVQYHSKTPIHINSPDLFITLNASDLG